MKVLNPIIKSFNNLRSYCEKEEFRGWDPYDGLNSKIFQALPLKKWDLARLALIQGLKRSSINFRKILLVPKDYNAKGLGLLLQGYCNLFKIIIQQSQLEAYLGTRDDCLYHISMLSNLLISLQSNGYSGACWGYNFDWQARRLFLFPKNTPTVVATCFCATALINAFEITQNKKYLDIALSSADFVLNDLHRSEHNGGFLFSYSPLPGNDTVYNASLLGSKLLSYCYYYTQKEEYKQYAKQSALACCNAQNEEGSWVYGMLPVQSWIDSFHTGYNLDALMSYQKLTGDDSFNSNIELGFDFYINNFFENSGLPKYYHNKVYPIDIHCPGQLFVTLSSLDKFKQNELLAKQVLNWTIKNMQDPKGYFYYQKKRGISSKISYMRWSNAFMFNSLSYYLLEKTKK